MFNSIGKFLVLINVAVSLLALSWAGGIFLQQVDFGWKEPRKVLEQRVPSEIDKRMAAMTEAYRALEVVQPDLTPAQTQLRRAEDRFGPNHLWYVAQLQRVRAEPKPIKAPEIAMPGGKLQLDTPLIGKPVFGKDAPLIAKSRKAYEDELRKLEGEISKVTLHIRDLVAQERDLTLKLLGLKDDAGKLVKPGLYALREIERGRLDAVKFEIQYLKPRVQETRSEATGYLERRADLEATLEGFKKQ